MSEQKNVESDSKGFIPVPGNENEGKVSAEPTNNVTVDPAKTPEVTPNTEPAPEFDGFHDKDDVDAALGRRTEDGPGFGDESQLPPEDFAGFASEDVEVSE